MERLRKALDGFYAFLSRPLFLWARPALLALAIPLALAAVLPLWHFVVEAPRFPDGLSVDVLSHTLRAGHGGADLEDLNALNHTIGMKRLDASALDGLDWLPFGFGAVGLLLLRVAVVGNVRSLVDFAAIVGYFALFSGARFLSALHARGHGLSADAPIRVAPFMPPVYGTKQIGDITSYAWPGIGAWMFAAFVVGVIGIAVLHLAIGRKRAKLAGENADA